MTNFERHRPSLVQPTINPASLHSDIDAGRIWPYRLGQEFSHGLPRQRSYLGGRIAFNQHKLTMDCLVRNVSQEGAKLVFSGAVTLPHEFDLTIERKGVRVRARTIWRRADEIGVSFLCGNVQQRVVPLNVARRLRGFEAENAALKRRVAQLSSAE